MALVLDTILDARGVKKGAREAKGALGGLGKSGVKTSQSLHSEFSRLSNLLRGGLVISAGLAAKKLVDMASAAEEIKNKFDVVFQGVGQANDAIKQMHEDTGYAVSSLQKMTSSMGDLIKPAGFSADAAFTLSERFAQLALDVGSFNDVNPSQVMEDFMSAVAGGSMTVTKYGMNVRISALAQEAFRMGLIKSIDDYSKLDASTKRNVRVQALMSKMWKDSKDAIGDLARTQGTYANQLRTTKEMLKTIGEVIGQHLMEPAKEVLKVIQTLGKALIDVFSIEKTEVEERKAQIKQVKELLEFKKKGVNAEIELIKANEGLIPVLEIHAELQKQITKLMKEKLGTEELSVKNLETLITNLQTVFDNEFKINEVVKDTNNNLDDNNNTIKEMATQNLPPVWLAMARVQQTADKARREVFKMREIVKDIRLPVTDVRTDFQKFTDTTATAKNYVQNIYNILQNIQSLMDKPLKKWNFMDFLGAAGSVMGAITGGGSLIKGVGSVLDKFQHGGEFMVGGYGGVDSQLVAFKGTPGERVTVTPATQSVNNVTNNNNNPNITLNIYTQNIDENYVRNDFIPMLNKLIKFEGLQIAR